MSSVMGYGFQGQGQIGADTQVISTYLFVRIQ